VLSIRAARYMPLSTRLIGRETLMLMAWQLRPDDRAFDASYSFAFSRAAITLLLDDFSKAYLWEAADTMINRPRPPSRWPLWTPGDAVEDTFRGITLRTVKANYICADQYRIVMHAQYRPEPLQQEQAA
jgi:hypothetical protein